LNGIGDSMSSGSSHDLLAFRRFLDEQIESGHVELNPQEVLDLWQARQRETDQGLAALETALPRMDVGEAGQELDAFVAELEEQKDAQQDW
jgi:hypothetical protein